MATLAARRGPATEPRVGKAGPPSWASWMWIWVAVGALVVLVVIGFLIAISNALSSINSGLGEANTAVTNVQGNAQPLPSYLSSINGSLGSIDTALKPIPGQADQIVSALSSIHGSLATVDGSLKNTSGSLSDTSAKLVTASNNVKTITGSLTDTSNILKNVLSLANGIDGTLESAERPETAGTGGIAAKVATINASLVPAQSDTHSIDAGLVAVNGHLTGICESPVLLILGALTATPC